MDTAQFEAEIKNISEKRQKHIRNTIETIEKLAAFWGEDIKKAKTAAYLHDITKELSYSEQLNLLKSLNYKYDEKSFAKGTIHAITAAELAKSKFKIDDEIYNAIKYHTTAREAMTKLEKLLYIADAIEPTRNFDGVEELREYAYKNLNKCMFYTIKKTIEDLLERGVKIDIMGIKAYNYYSDWEIL